MVNRERVRDEPAHEVVLGKLLDIQARLRGEPASAVPATRPIAVDLPEAVTVIHGDMHILSDRPEDVAGAHLAEMQARLAKLEAIVEEAGLLPEADADPSGTEATVTALPSAASGSDTGETEEPSGD